MKYFSGLLGELDDLMYVITTHFALWHWMGFQGARPHLGGPKWKETCRQREHAPGLKHGYDNSCMPLHSNRGVWMIFVIAPILQARKPSHREAVFLVEGHTAIKWGEL